MNDEIKTQTNTEPAPVAPAAIESVLAAATGAQAVPSAPARSADRRGAFAGGGLGGDRRGGQGGGGRGGERRGGPRREPRAKPEFDQKIISIRRVTRVASGGRRFSFAVSLVAGDRKGKVGVGTGKGGDTALAVDKAARNAKKNMITVNTTKTGSIAHEVKAKYSSARVEMMPAPGKGIVAGSSVRDVIDLAGIKDITAKLRSGTKNKLNNARAAVLALSMIKKPRAQHTPSTPAK
ncbi:MAG: 30S ribosomal protein S5 [Patescibacteria group bacterium]